MSAKLFLVAKDIMFQCLNNFNKDFSTKKIV
jgi:hypothetical protein